MGSAEPVPEESCGTCRYGGLIVAAIENVECKGLPPTPVVVGMAPNGPAISLLYASMPRKTPACALWRKRQTIIAAKA